MLEGFWNINLVVLWCLKRAVYAQQTIDRDILVPRYHRRLTLTLSVDAIRIHHTCTYTYMCIETSSTRSSFCLPPCSDDVTWKTSAHMHLQKDKYWKTKSSNTTGHKSKFVKIIQILIRIWIRYTHELEQHAMYSSSDFRRSQYIHKVSSLLKSRQIHENT